MKILLLLALGLAGNSFAKNEVITLSNYLDKVQVKNDNYNSYLEKKKASKLLGAEGELLYSTQLEASANYSDDRRPTTSAAFQGNQTRSDLARIGLSKSTSTGTDLKLSYNYSKTNIIGADSNLVPEDQFVENFTRLELSQSLLRNAFGREIQSKEKVIKLNRVSAELRAGYNARLVLLDAQNLYYQLVVSKASIDIQKESLDRSKEINSWTKRRYNKKLTDKTDYLQSIAALSQRELDYRIAQDEFSRLVLLFNSLQGVESSSIPYDLDMSEIEVALNFDANSLNSETDKLKAEQALYDSDLEAQSGNLETLKPDLKFSLSASMYGRNTEASEAFDDSFTTDRPVYAIGLSFTMPLDFSSTKKARNGYKAQKLVSAYRYKRIKFEEEVNMRNLRRQYSELKSQYLLVSNLEKAQKNKLQNEIKIQKRGRSTTFQVLNFEQEYLSTQMRKMQLKSNIAKIYTDLLVFK
jgi:outer membrane protein TolC